MKIITKKYKIIVLGDHNSGKSFFLHNLKNAYYISKNKKKYKTSKTSNHPKPEQQTDTTNIVTTYIPTDGINFYKYSTKSDLFNSLSKERERHENIFYLYDASGNKKKSNFNASFIETSQICLLIINPDNYYSIDQINEALDFWLNLYLQYLNKETYNIIFISINRCNNTEYNTQSNNPLKLADNEYDEIIDKYINKNKTYINTYYLGQYNIKSESASLSEKILKEIHNNNILNVMTLSDKKIEHNLKNTKLYFKKEINHCNVAHDDGDDCNDVDLLEDDNGKNNEKALLLNPKKTDYSNKQNKCYIM